MDLLLIQRDALGSSLVGNLLTALNAQESGKNVGILVTQEALSAISRGSFGWPRELSGQIMRWTIADGGKAIDLPISGGRGEGRQLDVKGVLSKALEAGVTLYACPVWSELLQLESPPEGLNKLDKTELLELIQSANQIIGTL